MSETIQKNIDDTCIALRDIVDRLDRLRDNVMPIFGAAHCPLTETLRLCRDDLRTQASRLAKVSVFAAEAAGDNASADLGELVFIGYMGQIAAVYHDGNLMYYGQNDNSARGLLRQLGYRCRSAFTVPDREGTNCGVPNEFDSDDHHRWRPPARLEVLEQQLAAWKARIHRERVAMLKDELARMEKEETPDVR